MREPSDAAAAATRRQRASGNSDEAPPPDPWRMVFVVNCANGKYKRMGRSWKVEDEDGDDEAFRPLLSAVRTWVHAFHRQSILDGDSSGASGEEDETDDAAEALPEGVARERAPSTGDDETGDLLATLAAERPAGGAAAGPSGRRRVASGTKRPRSPSAASEQGSDEQKEAEAAALLLGLGPEAS